MGGASSKVCSYDKKTFEKQVYVLLDTHNLIQYYASFLLMEKLPITLPEYKNFTIESEMIFNKIRYEENPVYASTNPSVKSYYDVYNMLSNLQKDYEKTDSTQNDKREKLTQLHTLLYLTLTSLISDLNNSCASQ